MQNVTYFKHNKHIEKTFIHFLTHLYWSRYMFLLLSFKQNGIAQQQRGWSRLRLQQHCVLTPLKERVVRYLKIEKKNRLKECYFFCCFLKIVFSRLWERQKSSRPGAKCQRQVKEPGLAVYKIILKSGSR